MSSVSRSVGRPVTRSVLAGQLNNLTQLIKSLFSLGEQGFAYDPNDLTDAKIKWRRNLFTETEFLNGVNDITVKGGSFAATTFEGLTQGTGIRIDTNASGTYVYKTFTHQVGIPYVFSCYVRTLDGSVPVLGDQSTDASADFVLVGKGSAIYTPYISITHLGNGLYRAVAVITNGSTTTSFGVVKYAGNSTKPVIVSGYQLEVGSAVTPYQPFTDFNSEFIKAFPLHTLYQDAAGTIPVTATGQPVGLVLDKSKGLVLGDELIAQPLNFNAWVKTAAVTSFTANSFTTNAGGGVTLQLFAGLSNKAYCITMKGTSTTVGTLRNGGTGSIGTTIPVGAFDIVMNTPTLASFGTALYIALGSAGTVTVDSISVKEIAGNHAYQTVSASRPILQRNATTGAYYLAFDGADDFLQTNNIDFTVTDKVSLFAGVLKSSDAAIQCVFETTPSAGGLAMFAPISLNESAYFLKALGSVSGNVAQKLLGYSAPHTAVVVGRFNLSKATFDTELAAKINGKPPAQVVNSGSVNCVGGFGNSPLYIARRSGTSFPFNGHLYSLIGIGRLTTDSETIALEKAIAKNTGVTLNV